MRRIDLASAGYLYLEKRETPMHVGGINLFTLPKGVNEQKFLGNLVRALSSADEYRKPFGDIAVSGRAGALYWKKDENLDVDYHVRHSALPQPGRYRELFALVSRLHGALLDRNRPLWEIHLIEGLQNRQFALYMKMHHSAIDGIGSMHLTESMCSTKKSARSSESLLSLAAYEQYKAIKYGGRPKQVKPRERELRNVAEVLKQQFDSSANVFGALRKFGGSVLGRGGSLAVPWRQVPRTSINTQVSGARRFVAQSWDLERFKSVCKVADCTFNDVVLAMCAGALRRYLMAQNDLPKHSLKAMVPVSLRAEGDLDSANAVGFITADLATDTKDPGKRLQKIIDSTRAGKSLLGTLSAREAEIFSQITQLPALLTGALGLSTRFPAFSTVISNVPGPKKQLYWNGASLDGIYPASIVFDGFAMNITLVTYQGRVDFGIIACRRSLPHVQRMIDFLEDSMQELEEVVGLRTLKPKRRPAPKRKMAKAKAKKKSK